MAARKGVTPAQLALAWLLNEKPWIVPIPGTRNVARLTENLGATEVELSPGEAAEIRKTMESHTVAGERYPASFKKMAGR